MVAFPVFATEQEIVSSYFKPSECVCVGGFEGVTQKDWCSSCSLQVTEELGSDVWLKKYLNSGGSDNWLEKQKEGKMGLY